MLVHNLPRFQSQVDALQRVSPGSDITGEVTQAALHVLGHFGYERGREAGSFTEALIGAWVRADYRNNQRLSGAFPAMGLVLDELYLGEEGVTTLHMYLQLNDSGGSNQYNDHPSSLKTEQDQEAETETKLEFIARFLHRGVDMPTTRRNQK